MTSVKYICNHKSLEIKMSTYDKNYNPDDFGPEPPHIANSSVLAGSAEHEYLLVSDRTSEVLKSGSDYMSVRKLAGIVRRAGGEVTIFKAIKG